MKNTRKKVVSTLIILSAIMLFGTLGVIFAIAGNVTLDENKLKPAITATVLDANGAPISDKSYTKIENISPNIINAFIAVEDKRFYEHNGLDGKRILSAAIADIKSGSLSQGASTITCQLIKNTQLTHEKTFSRKIKEAKLALETERRYTKSEIMEMYLNAIYFGRGIYGVENACNAFFKTSAKNVSIGQAATLAATVVNPSRYSPQINQTQNTSRRALVISLMNKQGYITDEAKESALSEEIIINYDNFNNNYYKNYLNSAICEAAELTNMSAGELRNGNYTVCTYLNTEMQEHAEAAVRNAELDAVSANGKTANKQIMFIDNATRGITAYASNAREITAFAKCQPGSTIKPVIYAAAIQKGLIVPSSPICDERKSLGGYNPKNYNDAYYGWTNAETALSKSLNCPAVQIMNETGMDYTHNFANSLGLNLSNKDKNLATALGGTTYGNNICELCGAYSALANSGRYKKPTFIKEIRDSYGKTVYKNTALPTQAMSESTAYLVTKMLCTAVSDGTAKQLSYLGGNIAAKTGTVALKEGNSAALCVGYTPKMTFAAIYSCKDTSAPLPNDVTGGNHPAKALRQVLKQTDCGTDAAFNTPNDISEVAIDAYALRENHVLQAANGSTPAKYVTNIQTGKNFTPKNGGNFADNLIQNLEINITANEVLLTFLGKSGINYRLYKNNSKTDYETIRNGDLITIKTTYSASYLNLNKYTLICNDGESDVGEKSKIVLLT